MKKKFLVNDLVMHCREGLSRIVSTTTMGDREYFLINAQRGSGESIYVPVDKAENIIRHLMNKEEANKLLAYLKGVEKEFNSNTKQRRDGFKRRLASGDVYDIAFLSRQLYFYESQEEDGDIKYGPVDLDMLRYADNILMDELALVFDVDRVSISEYIACKIDKM